MHTSDQRWVNTWHIPFRSPMLVGNKTLGQRWVNVVNFYHILPETMTFVQHRSTRVSITVFKLSFKRIFGRYHILQVIHLYTQYIQTIRKSQIFNINFREIWYPIMKSVHGFKRSKDDTTIENIRSGSTFRKTNSSSRVSSAKEEAVVTCGGKLHIRRFVHGVQ